jgi:hypothetical protein
MTSLNRSLPLIALLAVVELSCTTTNITNVMSPGIAPTITRFSPDTAWTLQELTIHGTNFGYDAANVLVTIDTARASVEMADDTVIKVIVPEGARSGSIHVRTYEQTATSAKPITIQHTFNPHAFTDSLPEGAFFSIPGSGMNNYRGTLRVTLNGVVFPIDSIFPDRIVSHVPPNSYTGPLAISDSAASHNLGSLFIMLPSSWNTLSQIWDRMIFRAYHHLTGYINGPGNSIDSTWTDTVTIDRQIDMNIAGNLFAKTARGVSYSLAPGTPYYDPLLQINWDNVSQEATVTYYKHSLEQLSPYHTIDSLWDDAGESLPTSSSVNADIEFMMPNIRCQITETTTDSTGLVNLQSSTTLMKLNNLTSAGSFDLILKH